MIKLDLELKKAILNKLNENYYEDDPIAYWFSKQILSEFGNYNIKEVEELDVEDEGKYQYGGTIYRILLDDKETDMTFMETWSRSGSYFTEYYYSYNKFDLCEQYTRTIVDWKVIECE